MTVQAQRNTLLVPNRPASYYICVTSDQFANASLASRPQSGAFSVEIGQLFLWRFSLVCVLIFLAALWFVRAATAAAAAIPLVRNSAAPPGPVMNLTCRISS